MSENSASDQVQWPFIVAGQSESLDRSCGTLSVHLALPVELQYTLLQNMGSVLSCRPNLRDNTWLLLWLKLASVSSHRLKENNTVPGVQKPAHLSILV